MTKPSFSQYMTVLFGPFVEAAKQPQLGNKLRTKDLPSERKREQFAALRSARRWGGEPVFLPLDSFVFRYRTSRSLYLCLQIDGLGPTERESVSGWALNQGLVEVDLDEAGFLFLVYDLQNVFKPKSEFLSREAADNVITIIDESYLGHDIFDVKRWYRDIAVFEIPGDHFFECGTNFLIAASIATSLANFRSQVVPPSLASSIKKLTELPNVNPENLYFALTATHWKHIILELYKCLEAAFYLPWVKKLREALGQNINALEMAKHCKATLNWREKENDSIRELFEIISTDIVLGSDIQTTSIFSDLKGENSSPAAYGERIYKIRNQNVHQYDYDSPDPVVIRQEDWPKLAMYLCKLVYSLYSSFSDDLRYSFEISTDIRESTSADE